MMKLIPELKKIPKKILIYLLLYTLLISLIHITYICTTTPGKATETTNSFLTITMTALGLYIAYEGLSTWKAQLKGQADHDLAKRILTNTHRYRISIKQFRAYISNYDLTLPENKSKEHLTKEWEKYYCYEQLYTLRQDKVRHAETNLSEDLYEACALWGSQGYALEEELHNLFQHGRRLKYESDQLLKDMRMEVDPTYTPSIIQVDKSGREILYTPDNPRSDIFLYTLESSTQAISNILREKLAN
ncbi:hypothetical protein QWZ03_15525 [Chitinimonas viridis]|uniref:Uncharacterized protein n=1 Tax=Chitinimonas viridis TaxID=664880 RepID=A0ABT8B7E1_9NEIS|nr:hypothetical protein [Chitinimonas viridis]MDN3578177.1 hypothetical protein [Chitinimonas viridis]